MVNLLIASVAIPFILLSAKVALADASFTADSNSADLSVRYNTTKLKPGKCAGPLNYVDWGGETGLYIHSMEVDWVSLGVVVAIPDAYLCGLKDIPQEKESKNVLGISAWLQNDGTVIIRNYFYPNADSVPCYWIVWPDGRVEFTALPGGGLLSVGLIRVVKTK